MDYLKFASLAVDIALGCGARDVDAYVLDSKSLSVEVANQKVESLKFANDVGIGVRVFSRQGTVGFAYSSTRDVDDLKQLVAQAIDNSRRTFPDELNDLPGQPIRIDQVNLADPGIGLASVEDKIRLAMDVEASAKTADERIKRSERCAYEDVEYGVALANSRGLAVYYRSGYCGLYGSVIAQDTGDVQSGWSVQYGREYDKLNPEAVGREAAVNAARLLGAQTIGSTSAAIVLPPHIAVNFFSVLIPALSADAVQKNRSLFKGRLKSKVMSDLITIIDDGRLEGGIATAPIDGEGVPTGYTELIVDGVLENYLYNSYTAARDGTVSTGNGVRHSFKSLPEVGPTNFFIKPGKVKCEKVIKDIKQGFYVTGIMGMHTANPISGDFSIGASGIWISGGEFGNPVRGVAIAGNILDLFGDVDAVCDDLKFFGPHGAPTLRIEKLTISGK